MLRMIDPKLFQRLPAKRKKVKTKKSRLKIPEGLDTPCPNVVLIREREEYLNPKEELP